MRKRLAAVLLCLALVLTNVLPVLADENETSPEEQTTSEEQIKTSTEEITENQTDATDSDADKEDENQGTDEEGTPEEATEESSVEAEATAAALSVEAYDATEIYNEEELRAALETGGEYTLKEDITISDLLTINTNVVLDLGGHTITKKGTDDAVEIIEGDLTLKNGTIDAESDYLFNLLDAGKLTIESGTYVTGKYMFYMSGSATYGKAILTVNGGTFSQKNSSYLGYIAKYSEVYIYGGEFTSSSGFALMNSPKATVATSAEAPSGYGYENKKYMLTEEEYNVPVKLVWGKEGSTDGPTMNVSSAGIYGNFWYSETDITINSGVIKSEKSTAIYHPQQGKFTMNGGYLEGATAIDAKMGDFTFNGGYVVGTGEAGDESFTSALGGTTADGSAIALQTEYYGATDSDPGSRGPINQQAAEGSNAHLPRNNDLSLTINDGVFISKKNAPVTVKDWNMCNQKIDYSITGGRFSSFPKTVEMKHGEDDGETEYCGVPICDTVDTVYNYLSNGDYKFAPAAYYDGVGLQYGFEAADAAYYASLALAVADRNHDKDARAYIYYLLDNGLPQSGSINRQLQIFYGLEDYCKKLIPENVGMGTQEAVFGYNFKASDITYNQKQYVLTDKTNEYALWSPAVTYDANGGNFDNGVTAITVLATTASGLFEGDGYGYVVDESNGNTYVTFDEGGEAIITPDGTILINPADPVNGSKKFLGWYYEDGTPFDPSVTQIKENMTVYAKWEEGTTDTQEPTDTKNPTDIQKTAKTENTEAVKTGDNNNMIYLLITLAAAGVVIFCIRRRYSR